MVVAARQEADVDTREQMYKDIQKKMQEVGPYAVMFQNTEQAVKRDAVDGFVSGPTFDLIFYRTIEK
jgi:peptide/nickel transport system substrate-binding protein